MNENATATIDWNTHEGKLTIVQNVMRYLHDNPTEYTRCLDYQCARDIVIRACKAMGNSLEIPRDSRVLFLPAGDNLLGDEPDTDDASNLSSQLSPQAKLQLQCGGIPYNAGSSLIITLPPWNEIAQNPNNPDFRYYACSYIIW